VEKIKALEKEFEALSLDELREKTSTFKKKILLKLLQKENKLKILIKKLMHLMILPK
jgi:preprotein translocase subunit SecA